MGWAIPLRIPGGSIGGCYSPGRGVRAGEIDPGLHPRYRYRKSFSRPKLRQ